MGPYVVGSTFLSGICAYAGLQQFFLWTHNRKERTLLFLSLTAVFSFVQMLVVVILATSVDISTSQLMLTLRTSCGCLVFASMSWVLTSMLNIPPRWFSFPFSGLMVFAALVNLVYPLNGKVMGIEPLVLPWGEQVVLPIHTSPTIWVCPIYALLFLVGVLGLIGSARAFTRNPAMGLVTALACLILITSIVVAFAADLLQTKVPYMGAAGWIGWLMLMYWSQTQEYKMRTQRLMASEHRLANLFMTSPDAICITRLNDGTIIEANPSFERIYGWTREEAIGHNTLELGIWTNQESREHFVAEMRQKRTILDFEFSFRRKNGSNGFGLVSTSLIEVDGVSCVQVSLRDMTERQRFEDERRRTERLSSLGLLASGVAHDFNNALSIVVAGSEMIRMTTKEQRVSEWAGKILDATGQAQDLVKGLLTFARQNTTKPELFDAHEAVRAAVTVFGVTARGIEVDLSNLKAERSRIFGFRASLQNAVLNLCLNARDAMNTGVGRIVLSSEIDELDPDACARLKPFDVKPGSFWRLSVADNGSGMDAETVKKCFDPFFTTKGEKGTGLGLASVHSAAEEHHGAVSVSSELGKGTTFSLWFPVAAEALPQQWTIPPKIAAQTGAVLVVDDDPQARNIHADMLRKMGQTVVEVPDGKSAIAWCLQHPGQAALVLLDMQMKGMSGEMTFRQLRTLDKPPRVVIATGNIEDPHLAELLAAGVAGVMQKPVQLHALRAMVDDVLGLKATSGIA